MKRNSILKSVVISTAVSMFLIGCSAVDDLKSDLEKKYGDDIDKIVEQLSIKGKVIDGYLKDAVVCLDLNQDGYCQSDSEPMSTTLSDGSFKLNISAEQRADKNFDEAMLLVFGGIDMDTGKDFTGKLYASNDGSGVLNISPLTTLVAKSVQKELNKHENLSREQIQEKINESKRKVAKALEIQEHEIGLDPIEYKEKNSDDKLIRKSLKVQKSIEGIVIASKVDDKDKNEKIDKLYEALADGLDDMNGEYGIDKLFKKASYKKSFKEVVSRDSENMLKVADVISKNVDFAFDNIEDDEDQLKKVAFVTRDSFNKIKEDSEKSGFDYINSIVYIDSDKFNNNYDWEKSYIIDDLRELGVKPTDDLVDKIKSIYVEEGIKTGVLFAYSEKLKDSNDKELENLYKKILEFKKKSQVKKDAQKSIFDGKVKVDLKSKLAGKTFYFVEEFDRNPEIIKINVNLDATSLISSDDEESVELQIEGNILYVVEDEEKDTLIFKLDNKEFIEFYSLRGEVIKLYKNKEMAQKVLEKVKSISDEKDYEDDFSYPIDTSPVHMR
jgi:hypothetical protein